VTAKFSARCKGNAVHRICCAGRNSATRTSSHCLLWAPVAGKQLEVQARYAGYIERQQREIHKHAKQEALLLPDDIDYASVTGLSTEARQRLEGARPLTLGHASRLEGVTPSTVSLLLIHLKKRHLQRSA
jgi:tRNA U34 5-carboxymethylaminomethyl modifying enzyme MnmG/GidA